jgi:lysozyme
MPKLSFFLKSAVVVMALLIPAGQVLAAPLPSNSQVDAARAELATTKAELAQAKSDLKIAQAELASAKAEDRRVNRELAQAQEQRELIAVEMNTLSEMIESSQKQIADLVRATHIDGVQQELLILDAIFSSSDSGELASILMSLEILYSDSSKVVEQLVSVRDQLISKEEQARQQEEIISQKKSETSKLVAQMAQAESKAAAETARIEKLIDAQEVVIKKLVIAGLPKPKPAGGDFGARVGPNERILGTDISLWQHPGNAPIDFVKMYNAGMRFIFIKGTSGGAAPNERAKAWSSIDFPAAREAGLLTGIYHAALISSGASVESGYQEGINQADVAVNHLNNLGGLRPGVLPIVLDIEPFSRPANVGASVVSSFSLGFVRQVEARTGKKPIIYSNLNFIETYLRDPQLANYPLWIANYSQVNNPATTVTRGCSRTIWSVSDCEKSWTFWQYTDRGDGRTYGIASGYLDMNVYAFTAERLLQMAGY